MKPTFRLVVAWIALLGCAGGAHGQSYVPVQVDGAPGDVVTLSATDAAGSQPLFVNAGAPAMLAQGNVGGRGVGNVSTIQVGFDYLRPFWSSRDFTLAVPSASAGSFPLLGDIGHVDDHFALSPTVVYQYEVTDLGISFGATGKFLSLTGQLERRLTDSAGSEGILTATSSLTIVSANLPEASARFYYDELFSAHPHLQFAHLEDLVIDLGFATRYSSIQQSYTGNLTNVSAAGTNSSTRQSTQSFKGLGIQSRLDLTKPVHENWVVFTNLRGSIVVGENTKESTLNLVIDGDATVATIQLSRTEFLPIGEFEVGTLFGFDAGVALVSGLPPPFMTIRLAATAQIWGDVGPLSAGSSQGFSTSNLYLFGAHIAVGFHR